MDAYPDSMYHKWVSGPLHRRKFARKYVDFPVTVSGLSSATGGGHDLSNQSFTAKSLSAGGIGILGTLPFGLGDMVKVEFVLPNETRLMRLSARVQSVTPVEPSKETQAGAAAQKRFFRIGLKFTNLTPAEQTYLVNYMTGSFLLY